MRPDTFEQFYRESHGRLLHRAYRMTGRLDDAHDLVQETFARAWQHWAAVSVHADPEAWLHTVAWRLAVQRSRKQRTGRQALRLLGPAADLPGPDVDRVSLVSALRKIPGPQREALVLHYVADLPVGAIAARTGVATGTVKARLARGRSSLAPLLGARSDDGHPAVA